jgi:hypothetical protein
MKPPRLLLKDPEHIIREALKTLGISPQWLADLMDISESDLSKKLSIKSLKGCEWYWISNALYIPGDSISFGYFRMQHKANVRWALREGYYHLPKKCGFWKLRFEIWQDVLRDVRFQSRYYGFRLRWKARYQDFSKWIRRKLRREHREYNPVKQAWESFREGKLPQDSFRPGLRLQPKVEKAPADDLTIS